MLVQDFISANTLNMMHAYPENPAVRGLILEQSGLWIPEDLTTFEQMKEWLEKQEPLKAPPQEVCVNVSISEQVRGTASFHGTATGRGTIRLGREKILIIARDAETFDGFMESINDFLHERIAEDMYLTDFSAVIVSDHQVDDGDGQESDYSATPVKKEVTAILKAADPETYRLLTEGE